MTKDDTAGFSRPVNGDPNRRKAPTFSAAIFFSTLRPMRRGRLDMTLPDGTRHTFGDSDREGAQIAVSDNAFFKKCLLRGDIGFAESYMDGDWTSPDLEAVFGWFILNADNAPTLSGSRARSATLGLLRFLDRIAHSLRPNDRTGARKNIAKHYDLSNEFFGLWLDSTMSYSSAIFERPEVSLEEAQKAKIDRLCQALRLQPGETVLEIGCGWGGFALHAAKHYGVKVVGLTLSRRQAEFATRRVVEAGFSDRIEIRLCDFRDCSESFDKIVSVEMMEALGHDQVPVFCAALNRLLKPSGLAALQFITVPDSRYEELRNGVDFIQKHIFPGSLLLSAGRVNRLLGEHGGFTLRDLRDLSSDYAETLRRWHANFDNRAQEVSALGFDERFMRKWRYYLKYCEAAFAQRHIGVIQTLYSRSGNALTEGATP